MVTPGSAVKELLELLPPRKSGGYRVAEFDVFTQKKIMQLIYKVLEQEGYKNFVELLQQMVIE